MSEASSYFLGYAKVPLHSFIHSSVRAPQNKNVERLQESMRRACDRLDPANFVSALIDVAQLNSVLASRGLTLANLDITTVPYLALPATVQLQCLRGSQRLIAAADTVPIEVEQGQWWIAKLYSSSISSTARDALLFDPSEALPYTQGEILRQYLQAVKLRDEKAIRRWETQMTGNTIHRAKDLRRDPQLVASFEALLPFEGLWTKFPVGALNRILPMRCKEELATHLKAVCILWSSIIADVAEPSCVDADTVTELELLIPSVCRDDAELIGEAMKMERIFRSVRDQGRRLTLTSRLRGLGRIISIRTCFLDTVYLEACQTALYSIMPKSKKRKSKPTTFRQHLNRSFLFEDKYFLINYLELILFAMRHFPELSDRAPLQSHGHRVTYPARPSEQRQQQMAELAYSLGFRTPMIRGIVEQCSLDLAKERAVDIAMAPPSTHLDHVITPLRCSRPTATALAHIKHYLFLENLDSIPQQSGHQVTGTIVAHDIVVRFFGDIPLHLRHDAARKRDDHRGLQVADIIQTYANGLRDTVVVPRVDEPVTISTHVPTLAMLEAPRPHHQSTSQSTLQDLNPEPTLAQQSQTQTRRGAERELPPVVTEQLRSAALELNSRHTAFPPAQQDSRHDRLSDIQEDVNSDVEMILGDNTHRNEELLQRDLNAGTPGNDDIEMTDHILKSVTQAFLKLFVQVDDVAEQYVLVVSKGSVKELKHRRLANESPFTLYGWLKDQSDVFIQEVNTVVSPEKGRKYILKLVKDLNGDYAKTAVSTNPMNAWTALCADQFKCGLLHARPKATLVGPSRKPKPALGKRTSADPSGNGGRETADNGASASA